MKVLFLTFEFPPLSSGGVHRVIKLCKYLPRLGHEIDVVTVRTQDYKKWSSAPIDKTLTRNIPESVRIHRISYGYPDWYWTWLRNPVTRHLLNYSFAGDPLSIFWKEPLFEFLEKFIYESRPDVLLATAPPFGVAVLASQVSHRYRLPWVMDWRDPWTLWCSTPFPSYLHYLHVRNREKECLKKANVSVCTSHVTREDWLEEFKELDPKRLKVIYNGFDPEDIRSVQKMESANGRTRIVHVGSFYYNPESYKAVMQPWWQHTPHRWIHYRKRKENWLYRSPYFFLKGLKRFAEASPELAGKLEIIFAGLIPAWLPEMLEDTQTKDFVKLLGPITHPESIKLQASADAVLLTSAKIENKPDYSIAGKTFEYLGLGKTIFGVLPNGAMRDVVNKSGLGVIANPDDPDAIAECIKRIVLKNYPNHKLNSKNKDFIASFEASHIVNQMAEQLRLAAKEGYTSARSNSLNPEALPYATETR